MWEKIKLFNKMLVCDLKVTRSHRVPRRIDTRWRTFEERKGKKKGIVERRIPLVRATIKCIN